MWLEKKMHFLLHEINSNQLKSTETKAHRDLRHSFALCKTYSFKQKIESNYDHTRIQTKQYLNKRRLHFYRFCAIVRFLHFYFCVTLEMVKSCKISRTAIDLWRTTPQTKQYHYPVDSKLKFDKLGSFVLVAFGSWHRTLKNSLLPLINYECTRRSRQSGFDFPMKLERRCYLIE